MNEIKSGSEVEILPSFAFGEDGIKCYPDAHEVGKIAVVTDVLGNGEYAIKTKEGGIYWARENDIRLPTKRVPDVCHLCGTTYVMSAYFCHNCGKRR